MTILFTELNRIIFTALYRTFSTSHSIEFTVNDRLISLSFTLCNRINYVFFKSAGKRLYLSTESGLSFSFYISIKSLVYRAHKMSCSWLGPGQP